MTKVKQAYRRAARTLGPRGDVLLTFAFVDILYGWTLWTSNPSTIDTNATFKWVQTIAPMQFWGLLWWAAAAACIFYAFRPVDRIGFEAAIGIKLLWGLLCLGGWVTDGVSLGSVGIWLGFARLVWRIAVSTELRPGERDQI